jgi:hypothetical protein
MSGKSPHDRGLRMVCAGKPPSDEDSVEAILARLEKRLSLIRSEHADVAQAMEEIVRDIRISLKHR